MSERRSITYAELRALRLGGSAQAPSEHVDVPAALKWIGALVIVIGAFFLATLVVLVAYQLLGVQPSPSARTTGYIAIAVLGAVFSVGGILVVATQSGRVSRWLARGVLKLGISTDADLGSRRR